MNRQARRRSAAGAGQSQSTRRGTNPRPYVGRQAMNGGHVMSGFRLLINGKLVEGAATLAVINPATGRTLTAALRADHAQLDQAVAAAKTAFPIWSATPLRQRAALLVKLAEALEAEQGAFARLLTQEQGKAKVAFTGSTVTGKKVMASAAGTLKRLTLELGGNDAAIV